MAINVGINGFGAIGRRAARMLAKDGELQLVAINDLEDTALMAHLFCHDSTYGTYSGDVRADGDALVIDGRRVPVFSERDPAAIPWAKAKVDVVLECTGHFTKAEGARRHIDGGGARRVVISAPATGEDLTLVVGVNDGAFDPNRHQVVSNASCTTNCLAPLVKVLDEAFGIKEAQMTTVHSYTRDQALLDGAHKDPRRARAAAQNIIPTSSGAAKAIGKVFPHLDGHIQAIALRVPTPAVSVVDLSAVLKRPADAAAVNRALREAAEGPLSHIMSYTEEPLVSMDLKGTSFSATVDGLLTSASGDLVKVVAWYDNEWGYATRLLDAARVVGRP